MRPLPWYHFGTGTFVGKFFPGWFRKITQVKEGII